MATTVPCAVGIDQLDGGGAANEKTAIHRLKPSQKGGSALKLIYFVKVPVETFWKFKIDFRSDFLLTNIYISSNLLVFHVSQPAATDRIVAALPVVVSIKSVAKDPPPKRSLDGPSRLKRLDVMWVLENKRVKGDLYMASHDTDFVSLPLLTVSETAKYLGVGRKIVYQLLDFGEIRAVKRKGAVLIEKASIDSFRSSGKLT